MEDACCNRKVLGDQSASIAFDVEHEAPFDNSLSVVL